MDDKAPVVDAGALPITETRAVQTTTANDGDQLNDPKGVLANRSVYFDFDKYEVKEEFNSMLSAHANYLTSHKARHILVQGNTDERGGQEYNLALGQKIVAPILFINLVLINETNFSYAVLHSAHGIIHRHVNYSGACRNIRRQ